MLVAGGCSDANCDATQSAELYLSAPTTETAILSCPRSVDERGRNPNAPECTITLTASSASAKGPIAAKLARGTAVYGTGTAAIRNGKLVTLLTVRRPIIASGTYTLTLTRAGKRQRTKIAFG